MGLKVWSLGLTRSLEVQVLLDARNFGNRNCRAVLG